MRHLCLIDGSGFIFRAFHAVPPMTSPDGTPINAVFGFVNMLLRVLGRNHGDGPDGMAVVFDVSRLTFRNEIYPDYKAHRPPPPDDLIPQFPLFRTATEAFNLPVVELDGFEADDLIATYARLAREQGCAVTIISSDKDLMQLIGDGVLMQDPIKATSIGPDEVMVKFGVSPDRVVDVQALCGDPTDNVPGVPGIGVKTAAQLITEYGDLDTLLARAGEIKQPKRRESLLEHADKARMSRDLVRLRDDVPPPVPLEALALRPADTTVLGDFLQQQGFRSLLARLGNRAQPSGDAPPVTATPAPVTAEITADYHLITDLETLQQWLDEAVAAGVVAIDTETTAIDVQRAELVGISLCSIPGKAAYIPIKHTPDTPIGDLLGGPSADAPAVPTLLTWEQVREPLAALCADPSVLKVGQNIKYDLHILARHGIATVAPLDDTLVLSYVLDGGGQGHGFDELCLRHFGHKAISFTDVCGSGKKMITFDRVPLDQALTYAAEDADYTLRLHRLLKPRLVSERMATVYETLERPLIPIITAMEAAGIMVDVPMLHGLSQEFARKMGDLERECHQLAGEEFNLGSPQQLGVILFDRLGLPGGKKTKTGQWSTDADTLEELAVQHPLPATLLAWRQLSKLKSTYTDALVAHSDSAQRVHTSFSLAATTTGRLASSDPNLQNIPIRTEEGRKIRQAFIAPPGSVLLSADYSQIELRLMAHVAGVAALKEAFAHGADIHAITAAQVFGVPLTEVSADLRRNAKAINFGIIYGMSAFGLARQLGISNGEAKAYIDAYFARYPEINAYMETTKEQARADGFVRTPFGRKVMTPGIKERNGAMRAFAERAAINGPIQGGAADIIKRATIRVQAALTAAASPARLLLQVHDELVLEAPQDQAETTAALLKTVMESAVTLDVPLVVEVGIGPNWAQAH